MVMGFEWNRPVLPNGELDVGFYFVNNEIHDLALT